MPLDIRKMKATVTRLTLQNELPKITDTSATATKLSAKDQKFLDLHFGNFGVRTQLYIWSALMRVLQELRDAEAAIQAKRDQFAGFGNPTTDVQTGSDGRGYYRHFQGGSIFWLPQWGAHEVHGAIRDKYQSLGWEASFLGYPTTDETSAGSLRYNDFEGGVIDWTADAGANVVLTLNASIEPNQFGAWVHLSGEGYTPGGVVRFLVRGLSGFSGDESTDVFTIAKADGTFSDVIWERQTWAAGGDAEMLALDESSGRSTTTPIPALY